MTGAEIVVMGKEVAKVLNNIFDQLPDYEQRQLKKYYEFKSKYMDEIVREDCDFDTLLKWRTDIKLLEDTVLHEILNRK